jgi:hypothetical protein
MIMSWVSAVRLGNVPGVNAKQCRLPAPVRDRRKRVDRDDGSDQEYQTAKWPRMRVPSIGEKPDASE